MLNCHDCLELLGGYLDGDLEQPERGALDAHLAGCATCHRLVLSCRQTIQVYRHQTPAALPAALHHKVMARVAAQQKLSR